MYSKIKSLIFSIALIAIIIALGTIVLKNGNNTDSGNNTLSESNTLSSEQLASLTDEELNEQEKLREEYNAYVEAHRLAGEKRYSGGYKNIAVSEEVNSNFVVTGEYRFRQIYSYTEIEFLGYEEIDDLSGYFKDAIWDGNEMVDYVERGFTPWLEDQVMYGYINRDGTLNNLTREIKYRGGEEVITENLEVMAVKLKIKYTNLSTQENQIWFSDLHLPKELIIMDDGKLYTKNSIYAYDTDRSQHDGLPIYSTMHEKFGTVLGRLYSQVIELGPKEEYIGEVIYLFFKEDFDNIYFAIDSGLHQGEAETNFNFPGLRLLPLTELKKLEGK